MSPYMRLLIALIGIIIFIMVIELVRRKKFREELSIVWLFIGVGIIILSTFGDKIIDPIAFYLGLPYPPVLIFIIFMFFFLLAMIYLTKVISDIKSRNKELSQKIALLEYKISKQHIKEGKE